MENINHKPVPKGDNPKVPSESEAQSQVDNCVKADPGWAQHKGK